MARRAALILEMERQYLIDVSCSALLVATGAGNHGVSALQRVARIAMHGHRKLGSVKIVHCVALLTMVFIRRFRELPVVGVFVTIEARRRLDFIKRVLPCWDMAFVARHRHVLAQKRIR